MYRFSRSIYRELAPRVVEDEWDPTGCENKQKVLEACEGAIRRLTYDRRYFARPARTLFISFITSMMPMRVSASTGAPTSTNGGSPGFGAR